MIFGTISGLVLLALVIVFCYPIPKKDMVAKLRASFKLPHTHLFRGRSISTVATADAPSFHPSLFVQGTSPTILPLHHPVSQRPASPTHNNRVTLPPEWVEAPLVPRRRQETEAEDGPRVVSMTIQARRRSPTFGPGKSRQPSAAVLEDIVSHRAESSASLPPPAPPPVRTSRPPRRYTVRNK